MAASRDAIEPPPSPHRAAAAPSAARPICLELRPRADGASHRLRGPLSLELGKIKPGNRNRRRSYSRSRTAGLAPRAGSAVSAHVLAKVATAARRRTGAGRAIGLSTAAGVRYPAIETGAIRGCGRPMRTADSPG